jgi:hypothetical protein
MPDRSETEDERQERKRLKKEKKRDKKEKKKEKKAEKKAEKREKKRKRKEEAQRPEWTAKPGAYDNIPKSESGSDSDCSWGTAETSSVTKRQKTQSQPARMNMGSLNDQQLSTNAASWRKFAKVSGISVLGF